MAKASTKKTSRGEEKLWEVIARVGRKSKGDLTAACEAFAKELEALDDATLLSVEAAFSAAMDRANHWDLWGAAYLIHGVISDDMFWDVRAGLVALGRDKFEAAIADADSLATVKDIVDRTLFEGFQYVPPKLVEERGLTSIYERAEKPSKAGEKWDLAALQAGRNEALVARFPRLAKRFAK